MRTRGRIAGLIATGAGFHPQLTGRENIYLNAAILGMSEAETNRKFDEITAFADIDDFLDSPVGYYSSGMYARLGFAIAIHVDADIFLADEALAVGDKPFKVKCMKKLKEIRDSGVTIFYVSHAAGSVRNICNRVLVLEKGVLGFDGDVEAGIKYVKYDDDTEGTDDELGSEVYRGSSRQPELETSVLGCGRTRRASTSTTDSALDKFEVVGVSTGNYTFVVTQNPFRHPVTRVKVATRVNLPLALE